MTVSSQAEILAALARIRSILDEVSADTKRTATQHERLAAWHTKRGEAHAARNQRHAGAVQQLKLADLDAAFDALDLVALAVLDRDPATTPVPPLPSPPALPTVAFVTAATNEHVIASSESHESKAGALNGIESVKRNAPTAEIDDQSDK
jgi:uncharacterized protein YegP (UPF0339 family)